MMAKRKKHRKKQNNHKQNVVKTTTNSSVVKPAEYTKQHKPNIEEKIEAETTQTAVMGDVRYSLILLGVIAIVFAVLYFALQNQSFSNTVYGLIKLNNISF